MILINPQSSVNPEIPNLSLAYIATINNSLVIDQNTRPFPANRFLNNPSKKAYISIRPFTLNEANKIKSEYLARFPSSKVTSISGFIDVLCCYPFVNWKDGLQYNIELSDKTPFPKYELFDSFEIFKKNWQSGKWNYTIMTSLGCPYQCIYCQSHNRKLKMRSAQNSYEELKNAKEKYGIVKFALLDDCFNFDKKRVLDFCRLIKPLKLKWLCTNGVRADRFDEDIAKAMAESGCMHIGFGAECWDNDVLNQIKKGVTIAQIQKAVRIAKKYFKGVHCFFIIGLPGATFEKDWHGLKWVITEGINGHFSYWSPFSKKNEAVPFYGADALPQSEAYHKNLQKKIYDLTRYMRGDSNPGFITLALDRLKLIWLFDRKHFIPQILTEITRQLKFRFF
jgi:radical SAM superfamily enzyme YgiQ (UPF0313 family)